MNLRDSLSDFAPRDNSLQPPHTLYKFSFIRAHRVVGWKNIKNYSVEDPDLGSGAFLTPGSGMDKKIRKRIRNEQPESYFREQFFELKALQFFDEDPGSGGIWIQDPGWKKFGSGIQDKHPGSATLINYKIMFPRT